MKRFIFLTSLSVAFVLSQPLVFAEQPAKPSEGAALRKEIKPVEIEPTTIAPTNTNKEANSSVQSVDSEGDNKADKLEEKDDDKSDNPRVKKEDIDMAVKSASGSDVPLVLRLASTSTGFVGGLPIALVRSFYKQTKTGAREICGDSRNPVFVAPAYMFSACFAAFGTPVEGVAMSAYHAWKGSGDKAFGQDSFSLGDTWE